MASTLPALVRQLVAEAGDRVALVLDGQRSLTLAEWEHRARRVAAGMVARKVRPGQKVALMFRDSEWIEYAVALLAVHLAGGTAVGLPCGLPARELSRRLAQCEVVATVHGASVSPPRHPGWVSTPAGLDGGSPLIETPVDDPDGVAEIIHTSGSTGVPKPVAVTHANLTHGHGDGGRSRLFEGMGSILAPVPAGTNAGHSALMLALTSPVTVHVLSRRDPARIAAMIEKLRVSLAILPSPTATRLVRAGLHERRDLSSVAGVMLGSAFVPTTTLSRLAAALPKTRILVGYGSTEAAPAFSHLVLGGNGEGADLVGAGPQGAPVGVPRAGTQAMILDQNGNRVPAGRLGEIWLGSPAPQRWYYGDPEATAVTFRDGWTRTGDLGRLDDRGMLYVFDRAADAIPCSGRLVSSLRVEDALLWHPAVTQAAVVGFPDPAAGQAVAAVVELRSPAPAEQLRAFAAERLEPYEVPTRVMVTDRLPCGLLGKVLKPRLRERLVTAA